MTSSLVICTSSSYNEKYRQHSRLWVNSAISTLMTSSFRHRFLLFLFLEWLRLLWIAFRSTTHTYPPRCRSTSCSISSQRSESIAQYKHLIILLQQKVCRITSIQFKKKKKKGSKVIPERFSDCCVRVTFVYHLGRTK